MARCMLLAHGRPHREPLQHVSEVAILDVRQIQEFLVDAAFDPFSVTHVDLDPDVIVGVIVRLTVPPPVLAGEQ